jgi:quinol monooxygenase YgiN
MLRVPLDRLGDRQLGRGDDLPAGRVMLADPRLVIAEPVEPLDQLEVARHRQGRVLAEPMKRGEKDAEFHAALRHGCCLQRSNSAAYRKSLAQPAPSAYVDCRSKFRRKTMIHVLAIITTKPGKRDEVLAAFRANMPAVHAEAGCVEYGPVIDAEGGAGAKFGADTFVVVEKWESLEHLGAHARSPHMAAYAAKTKDLLANREIHVCQPAA